MREPSRPVSIFEVFDDHVRAWTALAHAAAEVVALPARTASRLAGTGPEAPPADGSEMRTRGEPLAHRLAEAQAQVAALETRLLALGEAHVTEVGGLRQAYDALNRDADERANIALNDERLRLYQVLEPLLIQLPLVRHAVAGGREVSAADLLDLLGPLDEALGLLGLTPIGAVGDEVPFDPTHHQVTGAPAPAAGAAVVVKHPGYRLAQRILRRARVCVVAQPA